METFEVGFQNPEAVILSGDVMGLRPATLHENSLETMSPVFSMLLAATISWQRRICCRIKSRSFARAQDDR